MHAAVFIFQILMSVAMEHTPVSKCVTTPKDHTTVSALLGMNSMMMTSIAEVSWKYASALLYITKISRGEILANLVG